MLTIDLSQFESAPAIVTDPCPPAVETRENQDGIPHVAEGPGTDPDITSRSTGDRINAYLKSSKNKNTVRKTESDVKRFKEWLSVAPRCENRDILDIPPIVLDRYLSSFLMDVKKDNGDDYEPDTLTSIHRSIARKLDEEGYGHSLLNSDEFRTSKKVLEARRRELKQDGKGNHPNKAEALTLDDENRLWEVGQLGFNNPTQLINTVWYYNTKLLGFRGSHESRQLKWGDIMLVIDENGNKWLEFNERETKTRTGNSTHLRPFKPKMFENVTRSDRCPVRAYEIYSSKRPSNFCSNDDPFYLSVNTRYTNDSCGLWFKRSPMGHDKISQFMPRMAKAAGLTGRKTNHSVRRTMCTQLFQAGVAPNMIAQLSGHKNIQSINSYATANMNQQREMCNILQDNPTHAISVASNHAITGSLVRTPLAQPRYANEGELQAVTQPHTQAASASLTSASGLFSGAIFHGNVTININHH